MHLKKNVNKKITPAFLLPVALGLGVLLWPVCRYLETLTSPAFARAVLTVLTVLGTSTMISYMLPVSRLRSVLHGIGEFFYPLFLTALLPLVALDVIYYFGIEAEPRKAMLVLTAVLLPMTAIGLVQGIGLKVRRYKAKIPGAQPLRLVLLSDLHLGYFTPGGLCEKLTDAILKEKPELVIVAGDLFDDRFNSLPEKRREQIRSGLQRLTAAVPVCACEGNHDLLCADERKEAFLKSCGIRMLYDENVTVGGTRFAFRRDVVNDARLGAGSLLPDDGTPTVVTDHNPFEHEEAWAHGASLVLSGHTHAGQTFPGTVLYRLKRVGGYGFLKKGDKQLIVTSGAGIYGCPVRLGAAREIAVIEIGPEEGK